MSEEDWLFDNQSGQVKDWNIDTCCFHGYRSPFKV